MRLWKQAILSLLVLAAAGLVWARHLPAAGALLERVGFPVGTAAAPEAGETVPAQPGAGPVVRGAEVAEARIDDSVTSIGDGRAARSVTLTPYVSGRVAAIEVAAGDFVRDGQTIVRLDADAESIALDRARLVLDDARTTVERHQRLVSSRAVSEVQLLESELAVRQAELELRDAELALDRRVIRAPFDGFVGILGVELGDQVGTATEVATLDDRSEILVDFRIPERFVGKVARRHAGLGRAAVAARACRSTARWRRWTAGSAPTRGRSGCAPASTTPATGCGRGWPSRSPCAFPATATPRSIRWRSSGAPTAPTSGPGSRAGRSRCRSGSSSATTTPCSSTATLPPGTRVVTEGVQMLRPGAPLRFEGDEAARAAPRPSRRG